VKSLDLLQDAIKEFVQLPTITIVQSVAKFELQPSIYFLSFGHHHQAKELRDTR